MALTLVTGLRQRANYPRFNRFVRIAIRKTRETLKGDRCRVVFVWSSSANQSALMPFLEKIGGINPYLWKVCRVSIETEAGR